MPDKEHIDVLIIEDDEDDYFIARSLLSKTATLNCQVEWARDYDKGLSTLIRNQYDICLIDYRLGARDGLQLLREADEEGVMTPMILLTGQGDYEVDIKAMMAGAADYLVKGQIDALLLERSIRYARERRRAEERIREQAALLDKARDSICAYDLNRNVVYWNKSAERLTGYTEDEIKALSPNCLYKGDGDKVERAWDETVARGEWSGDLRQETKNGDELIVESRWTLVRDNAGNPRSILVINTDVTERKRLESHFLRAQRMESIGTLVGGIAHDLGNLLVPILLGVKVLSQRHQEDEKTMRTLEMIRRSAQRGSDMVKQVLAFARGVEGERVQLSLEHVIHEVQRITDETFPAGVSVEIEVADGLPMVTGDSTQLQQVIMNLCVNARDAMPTGGKLCLRAFVHEIDATVARSSPDAQPGRYICVHVSDTGTGIPPQVLDKVFEPFFTTKPSGKGTGLGLSTVYSIIKSHGGFVDVKSEQGGGTTFSVFLPTSEVTTEQKSEDELTPMRNGAGETILLVDDEEFILETASETLADAGFDVLTAENGTEAILIYKRRHADIDVVITDLMMANGDGFDLIRSIRELDRLVPLVAVSGMATNKSQEALDAGADLFVSKPFTAEKLLSAIHEVLPRSTKQVVDAETH